MTPTLVFDIETVPDVAGLRKLLDLPADTTDEDVAHIAFHQRRQQAHQQEQEHGADYRDATLPPGKAADQMPRSTDRKWQKPWRHGMLSTAICCSRFTVSPLRIKLSRKTTKPSRCKDTAGL